MRQLPQLHDDRLLVGFNTADDAGVFLLSPGQALIQTVDFFTPVVDDPYTYGAIAAANSLSDIYAMGGKPLTAMNIVAFPCHGDLSVLAEILKGGAAKVAEAGAILVGGHTIQDEEPKYGLSVTGIIDPDKVVPNTGARVGDLLILSKPLGSGIITTAIKGGEASGDLIRRVSEVMAALNKDASEAMTAVQVEGCTDITGFGLIGHGIEMAEASGVRFRLEADRIPVIDGTRDLANGGNIPGGAFSNRVFFADRTAMPDRFSDTDQLVLYDPQTSGGLLMAVRPEKAGDLLRELRRRGVGEASIIGEVLKEEQGGARIEVV